MEPSRVRQDLPLFVCPPGRPVIQARYVEWEDGRWAATLSGTPPKIVRGSVGDGPSSLVAAILAASLIHPQNTSHDS